MRKGVKRSNINVFSQSNINVFSQSVEKKKSNIPYSYIEQIHIIIKWKTKQSTDIT